MTDFETVPMGTMDELKRLRESLDEMQSKVAQAYQVIGILGLCDDIYISEEEIHRALDYYSDIDVFDEDFLPFGAE